MLVFLYSIEPIAVQEIDTISYGSKVNSGGGQEPSGNVNIEEVGKQVSEPLAGFVE
jgi:hypothetical protein